MPLIFVLALVLACISLTVGTLIYFKATSNGRMANADAKVVGSLLEASKIHKGIHETLQN